ncbi:DUF2461 domain-containing protein [Patiriisocius sp. Uisw_017]|jgi:uncharacterized protein (TIGR02453 family)|uniref:DUF2461 domain-containing protein n=1 Tax=Patiriisocius sp. Uisw_017 TaxID=3230968 RepID=UPI0039E79F03
MSNTVPKQSFDFLKKLAKNNHRDWMTENKKEYLESEKMLKQFYAEILSGLSETDEIEKQKIFRINRDIRFSKDKTPYNVHRSISWSRAGVHRRGGYYLRLEPGNSLMAGGFFSPEPKDLLRIRKEFEIDSQPIREILSNKCFNMYFNGFNQKFVVKTAPKGFKKEGPNIDLIRLKSFFVTRNFTDEEVFAPSFNKNLISYYELFRPYFDYMSEVLTTDLNGESLL